MSVHIMYLMAVMDWWSRFVISWNLSNTMEAELCARTVREGFQWAKAVPHIFNTDQGSQFTSEPFINVLEAHGALVSMDGRGRALDNVFIERLWRSVKYEDIYLREYGLAEELRCGLMKWFENYNRFRPHQALRYATPWEYHHQPQKYGAKAASWWNKGGLLT